MNTFWSDCSQKVGTLLLSRRLRFDDRYRDYYIKAFGINDGDNNKILEIGCGPGALCESLSRWYPRSKITGLDRDSAFLDFCRSNMKNADFIEGDATALPFSDNSFDVTISNTVQEHVETNAFFGEQHRVLKPGGVCAVLSQRANKSISIQAEAVAYVSDKAKELYAKLDDAWKEMNEKYGVCKYPLSESQIPAEMEKRGFRNVNVSYIAINLTPDNFDTDESFALGIINSQRQDAIDAADTIPFVAPGALTDGEIDFLKDEINKKYDKRVEQYKNGEKQWDVSVSPLMATRGVK